MSIAQNLVSLKNLLLVVPAVTHGLVHPFPDFFTAVDSNNNGSVPPPPVCFLAIPGLRCSLAAAKRCE